MLQYIKTNKIKIEIVIKMFADYFLVKELNFDQIAPLSNIISALQLQEKKGKMYVYYARKREFVLPMVYTCWIIINIYANLTYKAYYWLKLVTEITIKWRQLL